jgi:tetratricopeptide (TPR) repeat protein
MPEASERIAELRRELDSHPASRQFYQLGELLRRDGRAAEAMSVLRAGLVHHPRYVAAWVALARACLDRSLPRDAAAALHEAIELDAHNPVAWRLLGEARLGSGDRFGALDAMQHALQLAPGDEVLRAAVDALASETWPPDPSAPAAEPDKVPPAPAPGPAVAAAPPVTSAVTEAFADDTASPMAPPLACGADDALAFSPPAVGTVAEPDAVLADPFADVLAAPPLAELAPPAVTGGELADPFAVAAPAAPPAFADVFALPAEPAGIGEGPFELPSLPSPFLVETAAPAPPLSHPFVPVAAPVAEPVLAAEPAPPLAPEPAPAPAPEPARRAPRWLDVVDEAAPAAEVVAAAASEPPAEEQAAVELPVAEAEPPVFAAAAVVEPGAAFLPAAERVAAPEAAPMPPAVAEPLVEPPAAVDVFAASAESAVADELVIPPPADFSSTSAFAASPLDTAVGEAAAVDAVAPAPLAAPAAEPPAEPALAAAASWPEAVPAAPAAAEVMVEPAADAPAAAEAMIEPAVGAPAVAEAMPETAAAIPARPAAPPAAYPASRPTLTLARLHLQGQDFPAAIAILERVVVADPDNQEARDLLDLVHDMMAPLPGELPSLSSRERKIAALQGWLASLTLGQERMAR